MLLCPRVLLQLWWMKLIVFRSGKYVYVSHNAEWLCVYFVCNCVSQIQLCL